MANMILVAGATGGTGQQIVGKLKSADYAVRVLVRDAAKARDLFGDSVEYAVGSTLDPATLTPAMIGVQAVVCATGTRNPVGDDRPERVDYEGVSNLAAAARSAGVNRFILISSAMVTHSEHPLNNFGRVLDWKLKGENAVRASGLAYTIIRPGGLTDQPGGMAGIRIDQGDKISGIISRNDVAAAVRHALDNITTYHTTFEIVNTPGDPHPLDRSEYWQSLFAALKPD
jgi:uncharacterized protein YbjT (DUF2867 family)